MNKIETKAKLIVAALQIVTREQAETFTLPGPHDDAEAEYHDDRLLAAAREFVAAHEAEVDDEWELLPAREACRYCRGRRRFSIENVETGDHGARSCPRCGGTGMEPLRGSEA